MRKNFRLCVLWLCGLFFASRVVLAHPAPFTFLDLRLQENVMEGSLIAHIFDVAHDLNITNSERLLEPAFAEQQSRAFAALIAPRLSVSADGRRVEPQWSTLDVIPDRQSVRIHMRYRLSGSPGKMTIDALLFPYDPAHQTFLNVYDGDASPTQAILDVGRRRFEYFAATRSGVFALVQQFLPNGFTHIVIGPDHLLFLLGLLLMGGSMSRLALIVSAFTIANLMAASMAALNLVTPPTRLVEPAIALSIVYIGADNLLVRGGRDMRGWIAFTFGFIHGFGFAAAMRQMNLPARAFGWSIGAFSVGVEAGQLLVVVVVASALAVLRARSEAAGGHLAFVGSLAIIAAGTFWFIQRVFLPS